MTDVKFLQDYRGVLTGERYFTAGTTASFPADVARQLVDAGRVEYVVPAPASTAVDWTQVRGVGPEIANALIYMGLDSKEKLLAYVDENGADSLAEIPSVSKSRAKAILAHAKRE